MNLLPNKNSLNRQSGISTGVIVIIIIIALALIGLGWQAQRVIAHQASEDNYKEAKKLLLAKKPKQAYEKLLDAKSYALEKEGPTYYVRLAGIALTTGDKQAAKQHVKDGFTALKDYSKKDKNKINQQLKAMQKSIEKSQTTSSKKPTPPNFKDLIKQSGE